MSTECLLDADPCRNLCFSATWLFGVCIFHLCKGMTLFWASSQTLSSMRQCARSYSCHLIICKMKSSVKRIPIDVLCKITGKIFFFQVNHLFSLLFKIADECGLLSFYQARYAYCLQFSPGMPVT